jgi:tripartite-type tricarboxylate transporter receptor subunit TctC
MKATRLIALFLCVFAAVVGLTGFAVTQPAYPARPVKIVVPFPPGGGNDLTARLLAQRLQVALGQSFVVENRPGADGIIAFEVVKRAEPDGYTLLLGQSTGMTVNPAVYAKLPYDPLVDFAPISTVGMFPLVLVVNAESDIKTFPEFLERAKTGTASLNMGYPTMTYRLAMSQLGREAGFTFNPIPYRGSGPTLNGLLTRELDFAFIDLAAVKSQVESGKLRALAVASPSGRDFLPGTPTIEDFGIKNFELELWSGLFAPAGTSRDIIEKLRAQIVDFLKTDELQKQARLIAMKPLPTAPDQLMSLMRSQIERFTAIARRENISVE